MLSRFWLDFFVLETWVELIMPGTESIVVFMVLSLQCILNCLRENRSKEV